MTRLTDAELAIALEGCEYGISLNDDPKPALEGLASALRELTELRTARCEHCAHWEVPWFGDGSWGICRHSVKSDKIFVRRPIETSPDFGCVQFERAEKDEVEA